MTGPTSLRLAALGLAAIAGFSFYSGVSRQVAAGPRGGRSGQVVVIAPQPQIVAWQQGSDRSFGPPAAPAEPPRRRHRAPADEAEAALLAPPATAQTVAGQDAAAHEPAPAPAASPAPEDAAPPADTPPT